MDSLNALNAFVQVAENRSFKAAGQQLGVSSSAVGKSIARLEERVGAQLFQRSTRSIALTAEGARFLERCRRILAEIEAAEDEFAQAATHPKGKLKVGLPMLGEPFISLFADFQNRYPEVQLDLHFDDRLVDVVEEGFDAVLRMGSIADSRLTAKRLGTFRMLLVGSPDYFHANGTPGTPRDLADHRCILFRYPDTGKFQPWQLRDEEIDPVHLPASTVCSSLEARLGLSLRGAGIAYLTDFAVRGHVLEGRLDPPSASRTPLIRSC